MNVKKNTLGKRLISKLGALIIIISMFVTVYVVIILLLYTKYHESECAQHEPASQFLIGDILILRECPFPNELLEKALVESYSDEVPDA